MFQSRTSTHFRQYTKTQVSPFSSKGNKSPPLPPNEAGKLAFSRRQDRNKHKVSLDTILSHVGLSTSLSANSQNEPLCPPIHMETTYTRPPSGDYNSTEEGGKGWIYARMRNPTRTLLENAMTLLELSNYNDKPSTTIIQDQNDSMANSTTCAFSSGMSAIGSIILSLSNKPLHILLPDDVYHGTPTQLKTIFVEQGVTYSSVNMTDIDDIKEEIISIKSKRINNSDGNILIWMESPSNPLCKVTDIEKVCDLIKKIRHEEDVNILSVVDSTWAPPFISQPILLGADVVIHSGTKYLAGHSDVLIGLVTTSPYTIQGQELGRKIKSIQSAFGATASPLDCWLTMRGLRTLHVRLERQCKNAMELATYLSNHPCVKSVHYPGLKSHPQHSTAAKQMNKRLFGGMLSFEVLNEAMAMSVAGGVSIIKRATSLGGTETLIEHRASIEPEDGRVSPLGLLRVSVGLEDVEDLKHDIGTALQIADQIVNP